MVQAYILVQTEVGKAAEVAKEIGKISGVTTAEDVTGPYDVIVRAEADNVDGLGLRGHRDSVRRGHHPHLDVPRRLHLGPGLSSPRAAEVIRRPIGSPARALAGGLQQLGRERGRPRAQPEPRRIPQVLRCVHVPAQSGDARQ